MRKWKEMIGETINGYKILDVWREKECTMVKFCCIKCNKERISSSQNLLRRKPCSCTKQIGKIKDLRGKKFGRLKPVTLIGVTEKGRNAIWLCECECGNNHTVTSNNLKSGGVKSCGCLEREIKQRTGKKISSYVKQACVNKTNVRNLLMQTPKTNTSGIKGVSFDKKRNKWVAQICFQGKNYYLGRFEDKEGARKARQQAEKELFEPFIKSFAAEHPDCWSKIQK